MVRAQIGDVMVVSVTHPNPQRIVLRLHTQAAADYATELLNDPEKSGWRLERAEMETGVRCTCKDFPGADQFCTAHSTANREVTR